jgi:hypothetical protein
MIYFASPIIYRPFIKDNEGVGGYTFKVQVRVNILRFVLENFLREGLEVFRAGIFETSSKGCYWASKIWLAKPAF